MDGRKLALALAVGLTSAALAVSASADTIISFNFAGDGRALMGSAEEAGAPSARAANWNSLDATPFGDDETVTYEDGSVVLGGFTVTPDNVGFINRGSGTFSNDEKLFNSVRDVSNNDTWSIAVANVPFAVYDVYVYRRSENVDRAGGFTIGATTYYARSVGSFVNPDVNGNGYVLSTDTTLGSVFGDVDVGNYVKFSGLTGSDFTLDMTAHYSGAPRSKVAGFQIVAVPEPGTIALMATAGGMLFMLRRRIRTA